MIAKYGTFEYALAERYRFEAELGRGAMGTVYRARDVRLDRPVAIKMLHAALTNDLGVQRFQSEIRIAASLHHPNIVAVHDSGEADGRLFYVMDYLAGETLRARLERERQLSVDDALLIAEQVADGLQYAHDRGVVHRDIKPENILLADGRARVVDFGLARALGEVDTERLTASGLSVGTPQYLSPEQAAAEREVGPRADQYGLACVLYEMLVGEPPFTGPTATAVAMRHISEVPASLGKRRRTAPAGVDAAVMRALEKVPADRFGSVKDFAAALRAPVVIGEPSSGVAVRAGTKRLALPYVVGLGVLCIAIVAMIGAAVVRFDDPIDNGVRWLTNRSLDTSKYVVFPFAAASQTRDSLDSRLRGALGRWDSISVVSEVDLRSTVGSRDLSKVPASEARTIARAVGAGRYVLGELVADGGRATIRAAVFDAMDRTTPRRGTVSFTRGSGLPDSTVDNLASQLLFSGDDVSSYEYAARTTNSRMAFDRFLRAVAAMRDWNLTSADSLLSSALRLDGGFPQASLALAEVRTWLSDTPAGVDGLLARTNAQSTRLSPAERTRAAALQDLIVGRFPQACSRYDSLLRRDSLDFGAWYGQGNCNREDRAVVPDRRSPSGLRFRGSHHRASLAFSRAFALVPHLNPCCEARADQVLRRTLIVKSPAIEFGPGLPPDSTLYGAFPELNADTIVFIPRPMSALNKAPPPTYTNAVQQERQKFLAIAQRRVAQFPRSAPALEELAEAMELLGYSTTTDTIRKARLLATEESSSLRLSVYEAWLRLKVAVPNNVAELRSVRISAESLLTHVQPITSDDYALLAGMANLVGDADKAAAFSEHILPPPADSAIPPAVMGLAQAFLVYASSGGPVEKLRDLDAKLATGITNQVLPSQRAMVRSMLAGRAASLAFPVYRSAEFAILAASTTVMRAQRAFAAHDIQETRRLLTDASSAHANARPADLTLDGLFPEAWLWAAIGDTARALQTINPTLDALRFIPARSLFDATIAGALIENMSLRAQLTARTDLADGRRWARAILALTDTAIANARQTRQEIRLLAR